VTNFYDLLNIGLYLCFIVGIGIYFSRRSKNTSDYFRAGGSLPWWITGASSWMAAFTAWTFTGAAGKFYQTGTYALVLYYANVLPLIALLLFSCYRFRRLRVVTAYEAIRLRFGPSAQQFYTWIRLPVSLVFGALALNAVGVFIAAIFGLDMPLTLTLLGSVVTVVALLGGSYAVSASDFVQMLLIVTVTLVVAGLALHLPEIGGIAGLIRHAPPAHFDWTAIARPQFIALWWLALTLNQIFGNNSLADDRTPKYLMAKSDRDARLTLVIPIVGTIVTPLLWIIPPMIAAVRHPDIAALFPQLQHPEEAAFLLTAHDVLPQGMLGLLVCGIFAATLTHTDAALNQGAGLIVRNFYLPILNPTCPEKKLLALSKGATAVFGVVITGGAVLVSHFRSVGLFDLLNQVGVSLLLPLAIPACLGMFYRRTPAWSAWTTVLIGLIVGWLVGYLRPQMFAFLPGFQGPFRAEELTEFRLFATAVFGTAASVGWFFFTSLFYRNSSEGYRASVEEFFLRLRTPVDNVPVTAENRQFPRAVGQLCFIYGGFVTAFAAIPNHFRGRLCFLFCGGVIILIGAGLVLRGRERNQAIE